MRSRSMSTPTEGREVTFAQAINEAMHEEMARDSSVFVMGEDVAVAGGVYKLTRGLLDAFGPERVRDSPISEIMFGDFLALVMDQLVNQAAKVHYMSGGSLRVPLVIRTTMGAGRRAAAQHSQSLCAWLAHIPGLKVVLPSTPFDAKGLLKTAVRDNNPVIFFEDKMMYQKKGLLPEGSADYTVPFGCADVKRSGTDVTVIATSSMVHVALEAADGLAHEGIAAEVIDPRTLTPLDE